MSGLGRNGEVGQEDGVRPTEGAVGDRRRPNAGRVIRDPDPELVERPRRRSFTAAYKLEVLRKADACTEPGEIGALLRRERLYSSHLSTWRRQRDEGAFEALGRSRGPRKKNPLEAENAKLRGRLERAEAELAKARKVIEVQGNVSALLGELLEPRGASRDASTE